MSGDLNRLMYVDDSGHPQTGLVVYGWVEFEPNRWADVLGSWLAMRKRLWRDYGIPVVEELHSTEYVNGRGRISRRVPDRYMHDGVAHWKDFGRDVAVECLNTLRSSGGLRIGSVWRRGSPADLARTRRAAYSALVRRFEEELAASGSSALIFMDGDGNDSSYRAAHRTLELTGRRVLEDPIHLDSRDSQLIQMADLVAWTANAHVDRHRRSAFAHDWYVRFLAERDPEREPREI